MDNALEMNANLDMSCRWTCQLQIRYMHRDPAGQNQKKKSREFKDCGGLSGFSKIPTLTIYYLKTATKKKDFKLDKNVQT